MVLAKSKNTVGLGNSLMHDRFGGGKGGDMRRGGASGIRRTGANGESYITDGPKQASWVKMRSVTEQAALDEFLSTAELAGTDFTAEKLNNVKIIHPDQRNPYLLSAADERSALKKHSANKKRLTVPRRPAWSESMKKEELESREREAFLNWRRGLAELQEADDLLMTPFERNLEVWRQLWRVIERSDLVVQIVDARNPLLFRSEDLERYVKEVDPRKENLLLVNKADMMTLRQREAWARYFKGNGISYKFFSAAMAKEKNENQGSADDYVESSKEKSAAGRDGEGKESRQRTSVEAPEKAGLQDNTKQGELSTSEKNASGEESSSDTPDTRILSVDELEELFLAQAPSLQDSSNPRKIQVGLVGYPNVGKSSTINALIGAKKVSVSSTPGKTKHFQTIHLSPNIMLCDCPGLVFPNFASTKAELVCNGILPIDQLREFTGPAGLVCQRIPQAFLEAVYGIRIHTRPLEEGGTGVPTAEELLVAYAVARGFTKTGQGQPDESRAARYILKDYVNGKLLFCQPPPADPPVDAGAFNMELYDAGHLPTRRQPGAASALAADPSSPSTETTLSLAPDGADIIVPLPPRQSIQGEKSSRLDQSFFASSRGNGVHLTMPFNHKYSEQGSVAASASRGKQLSGRKEREMTALENGLEPAEARMVSGIGKKHFKGGRKRGGKERAVE